MLPTLTPRTFILIVGGILLAIGIGFLAFPASAAVGGDSVKCGNALQGQTGDAASRDAVGGLVDAMNPRFTASDRPSAEAMCNDALGTRRAVGWPLAGVGALVLAGTLLVQWPTRPVAAEAAGSGE